MIFIFAKWHLRVDNLLGGRENWSGGYQISFSKEILATGMELGTQTKLLIESKTSAHAFLKMSDAIKYD